MARSCEQIVLAFYKALNAGDGAAVQALVSGGDLEWRFYGPACDQHLMQSLTGVATHDRFTFKPVDVAAVGDTVLVEGKGGPSADLNNSGTCWVHVWTVRDGKVVQLREYFNTALTVSSSCCNTTLWKSKLNTKSSMPSLILTI